MLHPNFLDCIKLYGSLTLAHKISTLLNFFEIDILFLISGIGSLPTSAALPTKIDIITRVFLSITLKIFFV